MDDDLRKTLDEAIDAQVKGLAERQAINTAKYLNESYAAVRKEMNNEKLIDRLKKAERYYDEVADRYYVGEISPLLREAAAEIERLEREIDLYGNKLLDSATKRSEAIQRNDEMHKISMARRDQCDKLIEENNKLQAAAKDRDEEIKDLEAILAGRNDTVDTVVKLNDEHIREKIRLKEELKKLNDNHCATVRQSIYQQDKLMRLEQEVRRTALINKSFPGYATTHLTPEELSGNSGLTERDHIAIAVLEGTLSAKGWHPEYIIPSGGGHVGGQRAADAAAESAYKYADAMLKARKKR